MQSGNCASLGYTHTHTHTHTPTPLPHTPLPPHTHKVLKRERVFYSADSTKKVGSQFGRFRQWNFQKTKMKKWKVMEGTKKRKKKNKSKNKLTNWHKFLQTFSLIMTKPTWFPISFWVGMAPDLLQQVGDCHLPSNLPPPLHHHLLLQEYHLIQSQHASLHSSSEMELQNPAL